MARTTIRIEKNLKKDAEKIALENDMTFQTVVDRALRKYVDDNAKKKAKKIKFMSVDLGVPVDNLTRDDFYDDPKF